jgi:hypothetical protein
LVAGEERLKRDRKALITFSPSAQALFPVAPPVDSLDIVWMIVSPRSSHAAGMDVVGDNVGIICELYIAESTLAVLGHNLLVHQLSYFRVRANLSITAWVMGIVYPADSQLALASFYRDHFPPAAELRAVNWTQLITAESHGFLQFGFGGELTLICVD